jgi:hypothetical protein
LDVQRRGPVTLQDVVNAYGHSLNAESLIWKKGMKDWALVSEVPEVRVAYVYVAATAVP